MSIVKVYLLGGFGAMASIDISKKLINCFSSIKPITNDSDNIKFILDSESLDNTFNDDIEECFNNFKYGYERVKNYFKSNKIDKILLGVCCNTMHVSIQDITFTTNIELINMTDCVSEKVNKIDSSNNSIYLWSTKELYNSRIYQSKIIHDIEKNNDEYQNLITTLMKNIKKNNLNYEYYCKELIEKTKNNSIIILGCTELPLVLDILEKYTNNKNIIFIDCNQELAYSLANKYYLFT